MGEAVGDNFTEAAPYCGAQVIPAQLWSRWNTDPVLMLAIMVLAGAYFGGARLLNDCNRTIGHGEKAAFGVGWLITAVALISPLCALSVSLFSARIGQHTILLLVAAPLVAAGKPTAAVAALFGRSVTLRRNGSAADPLLAAGLFAALLWFWHAPVSYTATFASTRAYWAMHVSLFSSAVWLWTGLLDSTPESASQVLGASVISTVQMSLLGALITLAPRLLYTQHLLTTASWGLTPLEDQQLGGGIMWVPGCMIFFSVSIFVLSRALQRADWAAYRPVGTK
jgi:putative membrane protein